MSVVYKVINRTNGKVYVGSTAVPNQRRSNHFWRLATGGHHAAHLQSAYDKYGAAAFAFEVIEEMSVNVREREEHWIATLNACDPNYGYNTVRKPTENLGRPHREDTLRRLSEQRKGKCSDRLRAALKKIADLNRGKKRPFEVVEKIRKQQIGRPVPQHRRDKISAALLGSKHTNEARAAISKALSERVCTDETREKHSARWKGVSKPPEQVAKQAAALAGRFLGAERYNARSVVQVTLDGKIIATYDSGASASRATGIANSSIMKVIKGKLKTAGGFKWRNKAPTPADPGAETTTPQT